jgi:hypothetical protein
LVVLAVNGYDEPREVVEKFVREKSLKQKVLLMGGAVAAKGYGVRAYPTTFLIDREGKVVNREEGFGPSMEKPKEAQIRALLSKPSNPAK